MTLGFMYAKIQHTKTIQKKIIRTKYKERKTLQKRLYFNTLLNMEEDNFVTIDIID